MRSLFFVILTLVLFASCESNQTSSKSESERIDSLFHEYHEFKMLINPIEASKGGDYRYNDTVVNYTSQKHIEYLSNRYQEFIQVIQRIDDTQLDESQSLSLRVMNWDASIKLEGLQNQIATVASPMYDLPSFALMPMAQITSLQLYFSQLAAGRSVHPFNQVSDYRDWLNRVDAYLLWIDSAIDQMKIGMKKGIVLPKILVDRVVVQLDPFIDTPTNEHLFYFPIKLLPSEFSDSDKSALSEDFEVMIDKKLKPKYQQLRKFLKDEYHPQGRETSGIGALPDGAETYNYLIRLHTTTNMTADEIFKLGESEVVRIEKEMLKVKEQIGFDGDLRAFLDEIRSSNVQMPFEDPNEVIGNFNEIGKRVESKLKELFDLAPKASFEVRRTESFREASASAEYVPGSKDATRPGIFYVPIPNVEQYNKFKDEALFLHEAIPGHHYQLSLQQENTSLPEFLHAEGMGVFVEGWALYAESLGKELGLYEDPYQYFGMLSMEMHRAIRLVVDVGIHAKGWTREQAIQYSLDHEAESEEDITSEIERYMATPGQALSYKIGQLKILELRTRAQEQLGDRFNIRSFHNQVLNSGSLPLVLLEEKIDNWIKRQQ